MPGIYARISISVIYCHFNRDSSLDSFPGDRNAKKLTKRSTKKSVCKLLSSFESDAEEDAGYEEDDQSDTSSCSIGKYQYTEMLI